MPSPPVTAGSARARPLVLFVSYAGGLGGAERLLLDFAPAVPGEPVIACPPGALREAAAAAGLRTFPLPARPLAVRAAPARALAELAAHTLDVRRLTAALEPDVLIAWSMRPALAALSARRHAAALAFQHNDFLPAGPAGAAVRLAVRLAVRRMALVSAPSAAVLAELDPRGRLGPLGQVIAPGVSIDAFADAPPPAGPPQVLVLGALVAWKRPELALEIFARARAQLPAGSQLRFAGAPVTGADAASVADALRRRARELGVADAVELAGHVEDVPGALRRASVLLHCAEREPFGIAILEALAAGRPAVVADAGGPAEIVTPACGVRYPPGNAVAAAQALVDVIGDPQRAARLGAAGRAHAAEAFALSRQRAGYGAAVSRLIAPRTRAGDPRPAELAVVTVTHESAAVLGAFLRSVQRLLPGSPVVVADCGSRDASLEVARQAGARVLPLANVGFGRACNAGLALVEEPVVALLNPDVELVDDSLLALAAAALAPAGAARLFAPRVLNPDGTLQDTVHPPPFSPAELARTVVPPAALPGRLGVALAPWRARSPRRVGWAVGCAIVARTEVLRELGPFDERIFLYGEDMELGLRAARAGVETWFWPRARVIHHGGHSIDAAHGGEPFALKAAGRHRAVALSRGPAAASMDDAVQGLTFAGRAALKTALGRPHARELRQLHALRSARRSGRS